MEDEVDWSDGSLDVKYDIEPTSSFPVAPIAPLPIEFTSHAFVCGDAKDPYQQLPYLHVDHYEEQSLLAERPLLQEIAGVHPFRSQASRSQRFRTGVHLNRREPSRKDYANHVLYQANQKAYEATFLKHFINHALHSNQIGSVLPQTDGSASVERYLKAVLKNVNLIVTKMIWNTHSRTVNFLVNDGMESAPFLDHHEVDSKILSGFCPENTQSVVHRMQESWHRAWDRPPMVQYTTKDYPIGKYCSPFEEIDEAADTLFNHSTKTLSTGRAVKPPCRPCRKNKGSSLFGAAARSERDVASSRNWLHDLTGLPNSALATSDTVPKSNGHGATVSLQSVGVGISQCIESTDSKPAAHSEERVDATSFRESVTRLETLVNQYGPDVLTQDFLVPVGWRTRLVDDHKRRLVERWPRRHQSRQDSDSDIRTVVRQAIAHGIIKPLTPGSRARFCVAARIEQRKRQRVNLEERDFAKTGPRKQADSGLLPRVSEKAKRSTQTDRAEGCANPPVKKRKTEAKPNRVIVEHEKPDLHAPHPSGSKTLEPHQILPAEAYFERRSEHEKPAWRCGIKHAMGYYYNAGNRKNCIGCFTSIDHNPRLKWMDFYLPSRSHFYQPAPGVIWNPSKQYAKSRRSNHLSHNSIAKEAFWNAINTGAGTDAARRRAVEAVTEYIQPKTPPREPTPEPKPEPVDLGPHPSASKTMEHGQDIPKCASWEKTQRDEELAWRCDVNHAFGRYYLSGNKRSCPGCGSNKVGPAKHAEMDFYMPDGIVVRQEAPGLVKWRPRKPYKIDREGKSPKVRENKLVTHNQLCSKSYWAFVDAGQEHDEALAAALAKVDALLDARNKAVRIKQEELEAAESMKRQKNKAASSVTDRRREATASGGLLISLVPHQRDSAELVGSESDEFEGSATGQEALSVAASEISSSDKSTSSSDSE